jgi:hypothetical protein
MILRVYRRYREPSTDGYSYVREQTDYVVQSYQHAGETQTVVSGQVRAPIAGYNFALFTE